MAGHLGPARMLSMLAEVVVAHVEELHEMIVARLVDIEHKGVTGRSAESRATAMPPRDRAGH
jgi:hypothetical protein